MECELPLVNVKVGAQIRGEGGGGRGASWGFDGEIVGSAGCGLLMHAHAPKVKVAGAEGVVCRVVGARHWQVFSAAPRGTWLRTHGRERGGVFHDGMCDVGYVDEAGLVGGGVRELAASVEGKALW